MKLRHMRIIRITVSVTIFLAIVLLFLGVAFLTTRTASRIVLYMQFVPSLLAFISVASVAFAGFIAVLIITGLFGRVYCSFLCPLGFLQDVLIRFSNVFKARKKRNRFRLLKSYSWLHYSILIILTGFVVAGYIAPVGWFDPYSISGRIVTHVFKPLYAWSNNLLVSIFESASIYYLSPIELRAFSQASVILVAVNFIVVTVFVLIAGRNYCNTICPVGAVLRIAARFSVYRLAIQQGQCNQCGLCARSCKAGCINPKTAEIDFSRCVACYNCIEECKQGGIAYVAAYKIPATIAVAETEGRRNVLRTLLFFMLGLPIMGVMGRNRWIHRRIREEHPEDSPRPLNRPGHIGHQRGMNTTIPEEKEFSVSPPGSQSIERFNSLCIACHLCISVCPKQVLQPSLLHFGLKGFLQPRMDYHTSYCNYDCTLCGEVCPTGAILPLTKEDKHLTQIGKAWFIRRNCIVRTDRTDCGACSEHCPTKAVQMVPWRHGLLIPEVNQDICIGCGACEFACPTQPYKAIFVDGNPVHQIASLPETSLKNSPQTGNKDDFPF